MQPRTKLQVQVHSLSQELHPLYKSQIEWIHKNALNHVAYRTTKKTACLDCGHVWLGKMKVKSCICPKCGEKLKIEDTLKRKYEQSTTVALTDTADGFQVNRIFEIKSYHKIGESADHYNKEIVQQWFKPGEKLTIIARMMAYYTGGYNGDLEIRTNISNYYNSNKYDTFIEKILPESEFLPIYKRNGMSAKVQDVNLYSMMKTLLQDSKMETLLKAGQFDLLSVRQGRREHDVYKFWDSIKICMRNKYIVKDASSYLDYLDLLRHYGKDLRNPKYVCPANFHREHNRLVKKRAKDQRAEDAARAIQQAEKRKAIAEQESIEYLKNKSPYLGLVFIDGDLTIKVLESVQEFITESEVHKHCVYTNKYYTKPDSLIFSASVSGLPVETVEVSISKMTLVQSRGLHNKPSDYHDQIIRLMKSNFRQISKRKKHNKQQKEAA